jgi:hypothetical protein
MPDLPVAKLLEGAAIKISILVEGVGMAGA